MERVGSQLGIGDRCSQSVWREDASHNGMKGECGHGFDMELEYNSRGREDTEMQRSKNIEGKKVQKHGSGG